MLTRDVLNENFILRDLEDPMRVLREGELVDLRLRQRIYDAQTPILDVYFPLNAVLSVVTHMKDGTQIEIGTIGCEGLSGVPLLLGASETVNDCYCQVAGRAVKISSALFHDLYAQRTMRQLLDRYLQAYVNMLGQLAACNRLHNVYMRCARWLLTTHDRVKTDEIGLTHEFLAMMLGARRPGVTIALAALQQAGLVENRRGVIAVRDRPGLEDASCECYAAMRAQFDDVPRKVDTRPISKNSSAGQCIAAAKLDSCDDSARTRVT